MCNGPHKEFFVVMKCNENRKFEKDHGMMVTRASNYHPALYLKQEAAEEARDFIVQHQPILPGEEYKVYKLIELS